MPWRRSACIAFALFLSNAFLGWAAYVWAVLPYGSTFFQGLALFTPMIVMAAIVAIPVALGGLLFTATRAAAGRVLLFAGAIALGSILGLGSGPRLRMKRIANVVAAARPLTQAIHAFEKQTGKPPTTLSDLVPRYLAAVPPTGMGGYPEWEYTSLANQYEGNPWVLIVETGGPGINFDQLMYFPNQRYPAIGYGGDLERVGEWAYVHE